MPPDPNSDLGQFLGAFQQQAGGDVGNFFSGYRDMRGQIASTQVKQAEAQDLSARAEHQRMVNQSMKRQAEIMQQMAQKRQQVIAGVEGQIQSLLQTADAMNAGGEPAAAAGYSEKAAKLMQQLATVHREEDMKKNQEFARQQETVDYEDQLWAGVTNQADQDAASMQFSERFPGQPNPFSGMYDEAKVASRRDTNKAGMAWAKDKRAQEAAEDEHKLREAALDFYGTRKKQMETLDRLREKQMQRAAKNGPIKYPSPPLLASAEDKIAGRFSDLPQKEVQSAARDIASRAMLLSSTRGVDQEEALDIAIEERRNDFKTINETYKLFGVSIPFTGSDETHYRPGRSGRGEVKGAMPETNDKGWKLMEDAKGNRAYVSPNGREFDVARPSDDDREADVESEESAEDFAARQGR